MEYHHSISGDPHTSPWRPAPHRCTSPILRAQVTREDLVAVLSFLPTSIFTASRPSQEDLKSRRSKQHFQKPRHLLQIKSILDAQTKASELLNAVSPFPGRLPTPSRTYRPFTRLGSSVLAEAETWCSPPSVPSGTPAAPPSAALATLPKPRPRYDFLLAVPSARHVGLWARWGDYPGSSSRRPLCFI